MPRNSSRWNVRRRKLLLPICAASSILLLFSPVAADPAQEADNRKVKDLVSFLEKADIPNSVREEMLRTIEKHPAEKRWSGQAESTVFGVATVALPKGDIRPRATPLIVNAAVTMAIEDLLLTQAALDAYRKTGMTDPTTLRRAVVQAAKELNVTGSVKGILFQGRAVGDFAFAYVVCDRSDLSAHLLQPEETRKVKAAYGGLTHGQMRGLMEQEKWKDAISRWDHLRELKLISPSSSLDACRCYTKIKQPIEGPAVLKEAYELFSESASSEWLERCGDHALELGKIGEPLAQRAYERASEQLRNSVNFR